MGLISAIFGTKKVQFLYKNPFLPSPGPRSVFEIDCTIKQVHSRKSTPSKFPVEDGTQISDHIILEPIMLELEGIISDSPLSIIGSLVTAGAAAAGGAVGKSKGSAVAVGGVGLAKALLGGESPSVEAYNTLLDIQSSGEPVDVITGYKKYSNMWISNLSAPRDNKTGDALIFTVHLEQLILVEPATISLAILKSGDVGALKADHGAKDLGLDKDYQQGKSRSLSLTKGGK